MAAPAATVKPYQTAAAVCHGHITTGLYSIGFASQNQAPTPPVHPAIMVWLDYGDPPKDGCSAGGPLTDSTGKVIGNICGAPTKFHVQLYTDPMTGEKLYLPTGVYGPTFDAKGNPIELTVCEAHLALGFREISSNNGNFDVLFDYDEAGVCPYCSSANPQLVPHSKYHLKLWTTRHYGPNPVL